MKWEGNRQSDNVEVAASEKRPYGVVEVTRSINSGVISSIDPIGLNHTCKGLLAKLFTGAHNAETPNLLNAMFRQNSAPAVGLVKSLVNDFACAVDFVRFKQDGKANGLDVYLSVEAESPDEIKKSAALNTKPEVMIRAAKP